MDDYAKRDWNESDEEGEWKFLLLVLLSLLYGGRFSLPISHHFVVGFG